MSVLSEFEDRVAHAVEGLFAGAFRSPVQPVEIARTLARRMDDGRVVGVGRVYAPVSYRVTLSEEDATKLGGFVEVLAGELSTYLRGHAREKGYHLASKPGVAFDTDPDLKLGRFAVTTELAPEDSADAEPVAETGAAGHATPTVTVGEDRHRISLTGPRATVGRLASCHIRVEDAIASRTHAAFVLDGDDWAIEDLGSTNGTLLNGRRVDRDTLSDGDVVTVGVTKIVFHGSGE